MDTQAPRSVLQLTVSAGPAAVKGDLVNILTEAIAPDLLAPPVISKEMGEGVVLQFFFLLLRAQKKKQEKGTPTNPGPAGFPYFSPGAGRGKTRASPSDSSRVFSAPVCEARQDKWGERKNPIGTQPSTGKAAEKGGCTV